MNAKDAAGRLKAVHFDRLKRCGSLAETSRRMGEEDAYLSGQRENPRGLRVQDALVSLETAGNPMPEELVHEAYFSEPKDPAAILLYSKEHQGIKPDRLLVELTARLEALAAVGPTLHGHWPGKRNAVEEAERLRHRNRRSAYKRLRRLLFSCLGKLTDEARPRAAFGDLCSAMGVLAAIYRLAGRRDDAADLLALSWPIAVHAKDPEISAGWYQRAAYLLVDLKRGCRAEEFIGKAHFHFNIAGRQDLCRKTWIDHGYVLAQDGRRAEAIEHLDRILPALPSNDKENRLAAHQLLANNYEEIGDYAAAGKHLDCALALTDEEEMARAYCLSTKVHLLLATGQLALALATYREFLDRFAQFSELHTVIKLALDYVHSLRMRGPWENSRQELEELAIRLREWMVYLNGAYKQRAAAESLRALTELGRLDDNSILLVLEEIGDCARRRRRTNSRVARNHPPLASSSREVEKEARRAGR